MAGKRGAKILRKKKSQMFGIEYPFLFGFVILLVIIALVGSEEWNSSFRADRVSANARILAAASDEVYSAGPGSVKCVAINNPKGLVSGRAVGNEIIFVLQAKGQENEIASTTKSRGLGAIPISEGQSIICVRNGIEAGGSSSSAGDDTETPNVFYPNGATEEEGDGCIPIGGDPDCSNPSQYNLGTSGQCGDGISDSGETCEVGDACNPGFDCNAETCQCEVGTMDDCGDGDVDLGESCDGSDVSMCDPPNIRVVCPDVNSGNPGTGATLYTNSVSCTGSCACTYTDNPTPNTCGGLYANGVQSPNSCGQTEECEVDQDCPGSINGDTCQSCLCVPPTCGNSLREGLEDCDPPGSVCPNGLKCSLNCQCPAQEEWYFTYSYTPESTCGTTTAPSCGGTCSGGDVCVPGPYQWCECKPPCAQDPDACNQGSCERGVCERTQEQGEEPLCACVRKKAGESCVSTTQCDTGLYCISGACAPPPGSGPGYNGNQCASGITGTSCGGQTYDGSLCVPMNGPGSPPGTSCMAMTNGGSYNGAVPEGQYGGGCIGGSGGACNPDQGSCTPVTENPNVWICSE